MNKQGSLSKIQEKPNKYFLINIGIYCLNGNLLKTYSKKNLTVL